MGTRYTTGLFIKACPRRTARYERIPPDGFGVAALENCCPQASPRGDVGIAPYAEPKNFRNPVGADDPVRLAA